MTDLDLTRINLAASGLNPEFFRDVADCLEAVPDLVDQVKLLRAENAALRERAGVRAPDVAGLGTVYAYRVWTGDQWLTVHPSHVLAFAYDLDRAPTAEVPAMPPIHPPGGAT